MNPHKDRHRLTQLGDLRHGWAFPSSWAGAATEILASYPGELGAHNSPYDNRVLAIHQGFVPRWERTHDTLISSHIRDSVRVAALKPRAAIDIDPRAIAGEAVLEEGMRKQGWTWDTVPEDFEPWWTYGALDPVLAAHLWQKHGPEVTGRFGPVYDLERATARICAGMMSAGMMIDVPFIREKIARIESYLARAGPWLRGEFGISSVNSNAQVGRALNNVGIPTLIYTDGGQPSISKDTLRLYRNMFPHHAALIDAIGWCRKGESIIGRYLEKFLAMRDADDVIHCQIWTCRARTSRMSVTDPPMQTYDRDEPVIRGSFVPRPGFVFITIDADQIEARMTAHFTGDRQMIADFHEADRAGVGFFIIMASKIFAETIAKKDPRYTRTKNATYGQIYGSGLDKAAATAGVPVEQMRPVYTGTQQLYPGISQLMNRLIREGKSGKGRPQVYSLLGRRLYADRGHEYCISPRSLVLTADLRWEEAWRLGSGDELVGFDDAIGTGHGRDSARMRRSVVEQTGRALLDCVRVVTDKGPTVVSAGHNLIALNKRNRNREWVQAGDLIPGDKILWFGSPWKSREHNHRAAYLAGILDGEGYLTGRPGGRRAGFAQKPGLVLDRAAEDAKYLGYDLGIRPGSGCSQAFVLGGRYETMRFLGQVRPSRLLAASAGAWEGSTFVSKGCHTKSGRGHAVVQEVEHLGVCQVVTMKTSTGTFISDGFFSHNCLLNYKIQCSAAEVLKSGQVQLVAAGFGPYLRLDIHDEILCEIPEEHAQEALRTMESILTDRENFAVPITWSGTILRDRWRKT